MFPFYSPGPPCPPPTSGASRPLLLSSNSAAVELLQLAHRSHQREQQIRGEQLREKNKFGVKKIIIQRSPLFYVFFMFQFGLTVFSSIKINKEHFSK